MNNEGNLEDRASNPGSRGGALTNQHSVIVSPDALPFVSSDGITACLTNGGVREHAQVMAVHESRRTTKLYDRAKERLTQANAERIDLRTACGDEGFSGREG